MDIKERTLANGLKVVTLRDNTSPTVSIHVWYNVGSKNDPPHRNGFAHLFEHIMFKSTKNMKAEMMDRLTEDVGGNNNASTWDDFTQYYEVIPSNYLETLIWAEADRMSNLTVDQAKILAEGVEVIEHGINRIADGGKNVVEIVAVLTELARWKVEQLGQSDAIAALYELHVLETASMEVSAHRVLLDPECPECRGRR